MLQLTHTVNQKRQNNRIEEIQRDRGFYLDSYQGRSIRDFMKNAIDDAADITDDVKKHLKSRIKNLKDGRLSLKFSYIKCQQIFFQYLKIK